MPMQKVDVLDMEPAHCICDRRTGLTVGYTLNFEDGRRMCAANSNLEYMSYWGRDASLPIYSWVDAPVVENHCCYL